MEKVKFKVYLGFEDEVIDGKNSHLLNFSTNKVGGFPDCIESKPFANPTCYLCGLNLPLITQVYVPLENSPFHRTLYIFGCVNQKCWNKKESWVCLRSQLLDVNLSEPNKVEETENNFDWCDDANDWEDDKNEINVGQVEVEKHLFDKTIISKDEPNSEEMIFEGDMCPIPASAEIEYDDADMTSADIFEPEVDVPALLSLVEPLPEVKPETFQFKSFFINVCEESNEKEENKFLLDELCNSVSNVNIESVRSSDNGAKSGALEVYEKILPAHGDKLFHQFISKIQRSPGQLLRYIREGASPLFLYPPEQLPSHCQHCHGDLVFELQLLPTLISRLQLIGSVNGHIEFGTVLVMACKNSCWSPEDVVRSEFVLVQCEL